MGRGRNVMGVLRGLVIAYVVSGLFLLVVAFALWKWNIPEIAVNGCMIAAYFLSAFAGGFYLGKKQREKKFLWGILLGFCYILLLLFASAVLQEPSGILNRETVTVAVVCVLSGMLGGMIS